MSPHTKLFKQLGQKKKNDHMALDQATQKNNSSPSISNAGTIEHT
jgi:hypothetical protein